MEIETYPSTIQAFAAVLGRHPRVDVIALGEAHGRVGGPRVPSSLARFTADLLPMLRGRVSDIVIETWAVRRDGACAVSSQATARDVQHTTERPADTEQEVIGLIRTSRAQGIRPHILELSCDDLHSIRRGDDIDYDSLLRLLTRKLQQEAIRLRDANARRPSRRGQAVLIYGGHIHNDLRPSPEGAPYSFGPALDLSLGGSYLEIDLLVPELIRGDPLLSHEPWFDEALARSRPRAALLIRRGPRSWVIVTERTEANRTEVGVAGFEGETNGAHGSGRSSGAGAARTGSVGEGERPVEGH